MRPGREDRISPPVLGASMREWCRPRAGYADRRTDAWCAVEGQRATEFPDEAVHHRQAQPGPTAGSLGRIERLMRAGEDLHRHAGTGVGDLDAHNRRAPAPDYWHREP